MINARTIRNGITLSHADGDRELAGEFITHD
jgi:hypothetical protein